MGSGISFPLAWIHLNRLWTRHVSLRWQGVKRSLKLLPLPSRGSGRSHSERVSALVFCGSELGRELSNGPPLFTPGREKANLVAPWQKQKQELKQPARARPASSSEPADGWHRVRLHEGWMPHKWPSPWIALRSPTWWPWCAVPAAPPSARIATPWAGGPWCWHPCP